MSPSAGLFCFMNCSPVVNRLFVSLTSYANFAVYESFGAIVVKEKQVLLTTHKLTRYERR
jgi:hypothetical protein